MAQRPDAYSWIKAIDNNTGKIIPNGAVISVPAGSAFSATVRYAIANDSHAPLSDMVIAGNLQVNGAAIGSAIMGTGVAIEPKQVVTYERVVAQEQLANGKTEVTAAMTADLMRANGEEDERNNDAKYKFTVIRPA